MEALSGTGYLLPSIVLLLECLYSNLLKPGSWLKCRSFRRRWFQPDHGESNPAENKWIFFHRAPARCRHPPLNFLNGNDSQSWSTTEPSDSLLAQSPIWVGASLYPGSSPAPVIQTTLTVTAPTSRWQVVILFPGHSTTGSVSSQG